jgi:hypothetical protein
MLESVLISAAIKSFCKRQFLKRSKKGIKIERIHRIEVLLMGKTWN